MSWEGHFRMWAWPTPRRDHLGGDRRLCVLPAFAGTVLALNADPLQRGRFVALLPRRPRSPRRVRAPWSWPGGAVAERRQKPATDLLDSRALGELERHPPGQRRRPGRRRAPGALRLHHVVEHSGEERLVGDDLRGGARTAPSGPVLGVELRHEPVGILTHHPAARRRLHGERPATGLERRPDAARASSAFSRPASTRSATTRHYFTANPGLRPRSARPAAQPRRPSTIQANATFVAAGADADSTTS